MESEPFATSLSLLQRVGANDQQAWQQFVKLYAPLVYSWLREAGLQAADMADVSQEVFQVVHRKISTFEPHRRPVGGFRAWLWGIVRLKLLEFWHLQNHQGIGTGGSSAYRRLQRITDSEAEPESTNGLNVRQLLLGNAVSIVRGHFDPRTWQAFWKMAVHGYKAREVGEELQMTAKAVRQAKFRVTVRIRELLADEFPEIANELNPNDAAPQSDTADSPV